MSRAFRFLVVDDNEDSRFLARYALLKTFPGSQVIETSGVADAIAAATSAELDGVVTDHHLGERDGDVFMRQLRAVGVRCPIVMVTTSSDPSVHRRAYAAGAARVFSGSNWDFAGYFRSMLPPNASPVDPA